MEKEANKRTTVRIPSELTDKIKIFERESNFTTTNNAIVRLLELGLIRFQEDRTMENFLIQINNQNKYLIKIIEEFIDAAKS